MPEQLTPSEKFFRLLEPWSEDDRAFLTPEVQIVALSHSGKEVYTAEIVSSVGGQDYKSEALHKLGQLADLTQCRLVVCVDIADASWYGEYGFVWYRGNSKDVLVRRPQVSST